MAAVTICSDFGAPKNKVSHCFHCFPIYFHEVIIILYSKATKPTMKDNFISRLHIQKALTFCPFIHLLYIYIGTNLYLLQWISIPILFDPHCSGSQITEMWKQTLALAKIIHFGTLRKSACSSMLENLGASCCCKALL